MFPTLKSTGVGHFGAKFGEEGVNRCKPNLKKIWERHGAVVSKRNVVDIFCRLSTMHERERQTDKQTDRPPNVAQGRTCDAIGEIAFQRCRLIKRFRLIIFNSIKALLLKFFNFNFSSSRIKFFDSHCKYTSHR